MCVLVQNDPLYDAMTKYDKSSWVPSSREYNATENLIKEEKESFYIKSVKLTSLFFETHLEKNIYGSNLIPNVLYYGIIIRSIEFGAIAQRIRNFL